MCVCAGGQAKAAGVTPAGAMKGVKVAKDLGITPKDALKGAKMARLAAKELARIVCDGLAVVFLTRLRLRLRAWLRQRVLA